MMRALRILVFAIALAATGRADALPMSAGPAAETRPGSEPFQAFCGPDRCFARPVWRYRSGSGFLPFRRFGFMPPRPRFAPFGFRPFGGPGSFGGRFGGFRRF